MSWSERWRLTLRAHAASRTFVRCGNLAFQDTPHFPSLARRLMRNPFFLRTLTALADTGPHMFIIDGFGMQVSLFLCCMSREMATDAKPLQGFISLSLSLSIHRLVHRRRLSIRGNVVSGSLAWCEGLEVDISMLIYSISARGSARGVPAHCS